MECLSDTILLFTYEKAIELQLHSDFIQMIKEEIMDRGLHVHSE